MNTNNGRNGTNGTTPTGGPFWQWAHYVSLLAMAEFMVSHAVWHSPAWDIYLQTWKGGRHETPVEGAAQGQGK